MYLFVIHRPVHPKPGVPNGYQCVRERKYNAYAYLCILAPLTYTLKPYTTGPGTFVFHQKYVMYVLCISKLIHSVKVIYLFIYIYLKCNIKIFLHVSNKFYYCYRKKIFAIKLYLLS